MDIEHMSEQELDELLWAITSERKRRENNARVKAMENVEQAIEEWTKEFGDIAFHAFGDVVYLNPKELTFHPDDGTICLLEIEDMRGRPDTLAKPVGPARKENTCTTTKPTTLTARGIPSNPRSPFGVPVKSVTPVPPSRLSAPSGIFGSGWSGSPWRGSKPRHLIF